jgi:hypothetical protein
MLLPLPIPVILRLRGAIKITRNNYPGIMLQVYFIGEQIKILKTSTEVKKITVTGDKHRGKC